MFENAKKKIKSILILILQGYNKTNRKGRAILIVHLQCDVACSYLRLNYDLQKDKLLMELYHILGLPSQNPSYVQISIYYQNQATDLAWVISSCFQLSMVKKRESFCSNWFCYCTYPQFSKLSGLISSVMQIDSPLNSNSHYGLKDTMAQFSGVGTK